MFTAILAPTLCPACGSPVKEHTEEKSLIISHWCVNVECPGRLADMLLFVAREDILHLEGMTPEMARVLTADQYVTNLADLMAFQRDAQKGLDHFGEEEFETLMAERSFPGVQCTQLIRSLARAKALPWPRWIQALAIPSIGARLSTILAEELELQPSDMADLWVHLRTVSQREVPGFGFHKVTEVMAAVNDSNFQLLCIRLGDAGVTPAAVQKALVAVEAPLAGVAFVITGEFPALGSVAYLKAELTKLGAIAKSGVSKNSNLLLVGIEHGQTKIARARELGQREVGEEWLIEVFDKYGIEHTGHGMQLTDVD